MKIKINEDAKEMITKAYRKGSLIGQEWIEVDWVGPGVAYGIRKQESHTGEDCLGLYVAHQEERKSKVTDRIYYVTRPWAEKNKLFFGEKGMDILRKYILYLKQ